ncbi:hypothetical protein Pint_18604 [Pistacia integerrima]|uniref:Uncharacterized protein n=1 Tax=Pistacia integerrima TaxID=434235 RepID=A0ACC0YWC4_9ROSI|nr:hypothetical protein Pint_18604 [Pistacia integerrima]
MVGSFGVRKGAWTEEEDNLLRKCIEVHGEGKWHQVPLRGDNVNNPSPAWQPQALEHDHKWWESLLNDKEDNGSGSTCPAPELEGEPITNLWLQAIAAEKEMVDTTVENGKNEWRDISLEADDIWNLLSAI